jgi:DNA-binding transcriptional LysR family regulator
MTLWNSLAEAGDRDDRWWLLCCTGAHSVNRPDRQCSRTAYRGPAGWATLLPLPISVPEITISLLWHPRLDADPAHRWLRGCVRDVCSMGQLSA